MSVTITLILSVIAIAVSLFNLITMMSITKDVGEMNEGLRECATRTRSNKISLDTMYTTQLHLENSIKKRKPGRPKKSGK